jgi:hypothetical protein
MAAFLAGLAIGWLLTDLAHRISAAERHGIERRKRWRNL